MAYHQNGGSGGTNPKRPIPDERVPLLANSSAQQPSETKQRSTLLTVCPYILGNEFCERLAYYGLATNLVTYITQVMGGDPALAAIEVSLFEGTCYLTPIIGAVLADSCWGRYKTIKVFSAIYLMGMLMLAASSWLPGATPSPDEEATLPQNLILLASLAIVALGTGGIKPNVVAFGADQFDPASPQDKREKESFFNYFYLAINLGSLLACTIVVYVQDSVSWTLGFCIPAAAMLLAIIFFMAGSHTYKHIPPSESPIRRVAKVVWAALKNRWKKKHGSASDLQPQQQPDMSSLHGAGHYHHLANGLSGHNSPLGTPAGDSPVSRGGHRYDPALQVPLSNSSYRWLEDAITEWQTAQGQHMQVGGLAGYTPKQVEEVKLVLRLFPIFFATVAYWTIYTQMGSFFVQQGQLMTRTVQVGQYSLYIPSASMSVFNVLSVILLIPVYDKIVEPLVRKCCGVKITMLQRIGWGMAFSVVSMLMAGAVEAWRLAIWRDQQGLGLGEDNGSGKEAHLSILWQAPAYLMVGASEVLASIAQLEFFYDQAPDVMRSCGMALALLSSCIGSYLSGALVAVVESASEKLTGVAWLPRDLNQGRLDLFFYFLAALMAANILVYIFVAMAYEYKQVEHKHYVPPTAAGAQQPSTAPSPQALPSPQQQGAAAAGQGLPPRSPNMPSRAMPIAGRRPPQTAEEEAAAAAANIYARSLVYVPESPNLPAPFR